MKSLIAICACLAVKDVMSESVSNAKWSLTAKMNMDCDASLEDVLCPPCDRYELALEIDASGNTLRGDKAKLLERLSNGADLRMSIAYPKGPWVYTPSNVRVYNDNAYVTQNDHISMDSLEDGDGTFLQDNAYYYITVHATTGEEHVERYRIEGGQYFTGTKRRWPMKWYVRGGYPAIVDSPVNVRKNMAGGYLRLDYVDFPHNDLDFQTVSNNHVAVETGKRATEMDRATRGFVTSPTGHVWMKSTFKNLEIDSSRFNYIWVENPLDWEIYVGVSYRASTVESVSDIGFEETLRALKRNRYSTNVAVYRSGNVADFKDAETVFDSSSEQAVSITIKYVGAQA